MSQDEEALKAAIDDVNTVANELRDLQQKIQQYGEATKRLEKVGDALVKLSEGITSMHQGVASIVKRAEQAHTDITNSRTAVEALMSSVPDVVARIEASDTTESIREFTKLLGEVRDMMMSQQDATQGMQSVVKGFAELADEIKSVQGIVRTTGSAITFGQSSTHAECGRPDQRKYAASRGFEDPCSVR